MTEDEMVGWHHRLDGHGFGWTPGVGDGQAALACCDSWGSKESYISPSICVRGGGREELPDTPTPKARGGSQEEQHTPEARGGDERSYPELWLHGHRRA